MNRFFLLITFLTVLILSSLDGRGIINQSQQSIHKYRPGVLIVKYKSSTIVSSFRTHVDSNGVILVGIRSLDELHRSVNARSLQKGPSYQPSDTTYARLLGTNRLYTIAVPDSTDVETLAKQYSSDPNVEYATPDWIVFPAVIPNDPLYTKQWGHNNTTQMPVFDWTSKKHSGSTVGTLGFDANAQAAWDNSQGYGDSSIVIAIIDNGIEWSHPDLAANIWTNAGEIGTDGQGKDKKTNGIDDDGNGLVDDWHGWDFGGSDNDPNVVASGTGHGTGCAGIAAAVANNNLGVTGIAGGCKIMPLKVADNTDTMYYSYINSAIYYAADMGAKIISLSVGTTLQDLSNQTACTYAWNKGVVICAATGNENNSTILYPAGNTNVIAVGAASNCGDRKRSSSSSSDVSSGVFTDPNGYTCDGERWWGSNYGSVTKDAAYSVDVIAPTILPTTDRVGTKGYDTGDYYLYFNGTSCSTPYAAGVCALIASQHPTWTPKLIRDQLCITAQDIINIESVTGWDRYTGYGMVDADAATDSIAIDVTPPVISNIQAAYISVDSAVITWITDEPSNSKIEYGLSTSYGSTIFDTTMVTNHSLSMSNLTSDTVYHYRVTSVDSEGSPAISADCSFLTAGMYSYFPSSVVIIDDSITSGTVANLAANDASYLVIKSTTSGTRVLDWYGIVTIGQSPDRVSTLTVTYDGKYSRLHTQYLYLYRWSDTSWFQIDSQSVSTVAKTRTVTMSSPSAFISSNGEIRLRVYTSGTTINYTCSADWMQFSILTSGKQLSTDVTVSPTKSLPREFQLGSNFPNPFNPSTTIRYELASQAFVTIKVYNLLGKEVATLVSQVQQAGIHTVTFDGSSFPSGVYFCRGIVHTSTSEYLSKTIKLVLAK